MGGCIYNTVMTNTPMTKPPIEISQTQQWLNSVVIEHSICPFAKREFVNNTIHYEIIDNVKIEQQLEQLIVNCENLDNDDAIETSLLIFPNSLSDFDDYLDFLDLAKP